jgi:hypothetical protein
VADRKLKLPAEFSALTAAELARQLSSDGRPPVTSADIDRQVQAGAPANADGSIDLAPFAAWLVKETPRAS